MTEKKEVRGSGRVIVVALLTAIVVTFGAIAYIGLTGGGTAGTATGDAAAGALTATPGRPGTPATTGTTASGEAPVAKTVNDRAARDAIRRRILEAWARGDDETAAAARTGRIPPMPEKADGGVDPNYIREVVRSDLFPMVRGCYEEMLTRKDAGGTLVMSFKIVGDENIGGIVEEADVENEGGLDDEKLTTCIRESTMSLAFRPPPRGGWVTVKYPMILSPD
jgi:hypothetical protein